MSPTDTLTLVAAVGCGALGGVFFAFSAFVMNGLQRLPPAQGIAAMQSINVTAVRPAFMTALLGTAVICVLLAIVSLRDWGDRRAALLLIGSIFYLAAAIALTIGHHVPLNDALATVDANSPEAASRWTDYLESWTVWNHVRAAGALTAAGAFVAACHD